MGIDFILGLLLKGFKFFIVIGVIAFLLSYFQPFLIFIIYHLNIGLYILFGLVLDWSIKYISLFAFFLFFFSVFKMFKKYF